MTQGYSPQWKKRAVPMEPLHGAMSRFCAQTILQLKANAITQSVYPTEVYPGYSVINEARKAMAGGKHENGWWSEGRGAREIDGRLIEASDESRVTFQFDVLNYMRYVDLGVGSGTTAEQVERGRNAHYKRRYEPHWSAREHRRHRPFLYMEIRHLGERASRYLLDFYGYEAQFKVMEIFEGMKLDVSPI